MGQPKSKLSREEIKEMLNNSKLTEKELLQFHNELFRSHPTGKLNRDEFIEIYGKLGLQSANKNMMNNIFRALDSNKDGSIEFREFLVLLSVSSRGTPEERLSLAFKIYDLNADGFICRDEMELIIANVYYLNRGFKDFKKATQKAKQQANKFIEKMDINKDGKVSLEEFLSQSKKASGMKDFMKSS